MTELQSKRVLLIEDDAYSVAIMRATLERAGAILFVERFGESIIARLSALKPLDMVLLDLQLPRNHGFNLYDDLRANLPSAPIVVVSGTGNAEDMQHARQIGCNGYINKPIQPRRFIEQLTTILNGTPVWD